MNWKKLLCFGIGHKYKYCWALSIDPSYWHQGRTTFICERCNHTYTTTPNKEGM